VLCLIISVDAPNAPDLAEELSQRLSGRQLISNGFILTAFEYRAILDLSDSSNETIDKVDADIADWIKFKHSTLKKRKLSGKRQKQVTDTPPDTQDLVCIEIKR